MSILDEGHDPRSNPTGRVEPPSLIRAERLPPTFLHTEAPRKVQTPSMMEELARVIERPPKLPKIGADASDSMRRCFETVAADIEQLAAEHVERAAQLQQEALSFSAIIREAGERLCEKIEQEALRGFQISKIMTTSRQMLTDPAKPGENPPG